MKRLLSVILVVLLTIGLTFTVMAEESASGNCGENLTWEYDGATGTLTISGTGPIDDYSTYNRPWGKYEDKIESVIIGDAVTRIGNYNFYGCDNLTSITFGNGVTAIGESAFQFCSRITGELVIPDGITSIESRAFADCAITSVKFGSGIKTVGTDEFTYNRIESFSASEESLYFCAEDGVLFSKDKSAIIRYPMPKQGNYILPDSVKVIKSYAFSGFKGKIMINTVLDEIEHNAFDSVVLSDRTVCSVYFMAGQPLLSYADSFDKTYVLLYYLKETEDKWTFDEDGLWNGFDVYPYEDGETVEFDPSLYIASGYCGDNFSDDKNLAWMIDKNGTLTIKGKGYMRDYGYKEFHTGEHNITDAPWSDYYYEVNKLVIEDGVIGIGNYAFFVMDTLKGELVLPDSIRRIGESAFCACDGFEGEIVVPEGVKTLKYMTFLGCNNIYCVNLPSTYVGPFNSQIFDMENLLEINIHEDNKQFCSVDGVVFSKDMKKLIIVPEARTGSYTVPETVETVEINAFQGSQLSEIVLPACYTEDSQYSVFHDAENLESIKYHENNEKYCSVNGAVLTKDGKTLLYVPKGKTGTFTVPETVETITENSFRSTGLSEIIISESVKTIEKEAIRIPSGNYATVIIKGNETVMERHFIRVPNNGSNAGADVLFLNGEPKIDKHNTLFSGPINLYYLAGTEDKWTFDDNGLWGKHAVTKFYGFGVEDTTDHSNHNTEIRNKFDCTCTDYGYSGNKFCADCGVVYEIGVITEPCHNYTSTVITPTCTEQGRITYTCDKCGDTYTLNSDATGHSVNDDGMCDTCGELIEEPTVLDRIIKTFENIFDFIIKFFVNIFNFMYGVLDSII